MKKLLILAVIVVAVAGLIFGLTRTEAPEEGLKIESFSSPEEFKEYLMKSSEFSSFYTLSYTARKAEVVVDSKSVGETQTIPERYSETNVQVKGIDEPDIVKTDGVNIYYSPYPWLRYFIYPEGKQYGGETMFIRAFPPTNLSKIAEISDSGNLLLYDNVLVVLSYDEINAYNVETQKKVWSADINGSYVDARLYEGKLYLVTRSGVNFVEPCPIRPLSVNGKAVEVACGRIYHPTIPVTVDTTYTVLKMDAKTGEVENSISFVGSSGHTVVYMSKNAIYVTFNTFADPAKLTYQFISENPDLVPEWVREKIEKLMDYDISSRAKQVEIMYILEQLRASMNEEERLKFENEWHNRWEKFTEEHSREIEKTHIAKFSLQLEAEGINSFPGRLLNQFSLDEYDGYLRVATTVGNENDLYVLDENLDVVGKIQGFGLDERIYSVRFDGDVGFIVTFRQTDPFFVLDLSNPENPEIVGELKISGFSSYLHRIDEKTVLGIGKEDGNVKISLFDISDLTNPVEKDRYVLQEYWSEVMSNHHAFLLDKEHGIFFLPAGQNGYVFSYEDGLEMVKAVKGDAVRAIYIDDYLYVIGPEEIKVYDENSWERVAELELSS